MIENIKQRIFPFIIALAALSVSASAAFYSVTGLSKLFAGASLAVMIMAGSLEVSKLVIASLLYQYWDKLNKFLRTYLSIAVFILIVITSMGIYGFLSAAYQQTSALAGNVDAQVELLETKKSNYTQQLEGYTQEKISLNQSILDLREGLSNNTIQYKDRETGEIITTTSSSTRKSLERQLDQAIERQTQINTRIDSLNQRIFNLNTEIVETQTSNDIAAELGPLKYLASITGWEMDKIVNVLLLVIIFVFDPLAIALVIAANFAFARINSNTSYPEEKENIDLDIQYEDLKKEIEEMESEWEATVDDGLEELENDFDSSDSDGEEVIKDSSENQAPPQDPNLSAWRRNKMRKEGGDSTSKRYF